MQRLTISFAASAISVALIACSSGGTGSSGSSGGETSSGGAVSSGGKTTTGSGGAATGGAANGGSANGGASATSGGAQSSGGTQSSGGASNGGTTSGGASSGGSGGQSTGGSSSASGGRANGGTSGGGASSGGASNSGGKPNGGASSGGGSNGGAGGGSGAYNPCSSPCKILPFGDSITHGLQSSDSGGYRSQLFKLIVAANKKVTFLGSQSDGPGTVSGVSFPKNHEGHDGYTVDSGFSKYGTPGISSLIPSPAFNTIPDIVLLMIGTNDITSTNSPGSTSMRLDGLLGKIVAAAPNALIVVAEITPVSYTSADLTNYNSKIPGIVQAHAAQGQHIVLADMSQMPKSGLASDGVHPNDEGYAYMAKNWFAAIQNLLPQ